MTDSVQAQDGPRDWRQRTYWYTHEVGVLRLVRFIMGKVVYLLAKVECSGLEHFPPTGPCIVAANHLDMWDIILFGLYLPRHPFFMAKAELFRIPLLSQAIRWGGAFPVNRGEKDTWAMEQAGRVLAAGQVLFLFPEGHRSGRRAQLGQGKVGAVKLALECGVPLVPAAIFGTQEMGLGPRARVSFQVAPPLDLVALAGPPPYRPETLRELTDLLMRRIAAMLPPGHRGKYG